MQHRDNHVVLERKRASVWLQDAPCHIVLGLFNWEVWICPLCTHSSAWISITAALWGCVGVLPGVVSSLGGTAVPLHYEVMQVVVSLHWEDPRLPPKAGK